MAMSSTYTANRFFGGSMFFPLQLHFLGDKVSLVKPGLFTTWERTIPLSKVASVTAKLGPVTGTVIVESSGGSEDIVASGFNRGDIERFRMELESALA
jgi:hypothetical protein